MAQTLQVTAVVKAVKVASDSIVFYQFNDPRKSQLHERVLDSRQICSNNIHSYQFTKDHTTSTDPSPIPIPPPVSAAIAAAGSLRSFMAQSGHRFPTTADTEKLPSPATVRTKFLEEIPGTLTSIGDKNFLANVLGEMCRA